MDVLRISIRSLIATKYVLGIFTKDSATLAQGYKYYAAFQLRDIAKKYQ